MPHVIVRPLEHDDASDWWALWEAYCASYPAMIPPQVTERTWARFHDPDVPMGCLVATRHDGRLVGFATWIAHPTTFSDRPLGYMEDLFVVPEARRAGVASQLVKATAVIGRTKGWLKLYWSTRGDNTAARGMYEKLARPVDWVYYEISM